jgi:signal transduction histidine kinase
MSLSTHFQDLNRKIFDEGKHQSAAIQFGQLALSILDAGELMQQAAALISRTLNVELIWICELDGQRNRVVRQAGWGWNDGVPDDSGEFPAFNSLEALTLRMAYPVYIENLATETRFNPARRMLEQGIVSGISIPMGTPEKSLGLIQVFTRQAQIFSQEDVSFLQWIGNILGLAIQRTHLKDENRELRKQLSSAQSKQSEWDSYEIKSRLRDSREKERLRLAQELHDVPIQDLYGLIYQIDDLRDYVKDADGERILNEHMEMLQRVVNSLRTICRELRPPSLSPFGLEVAIRDHVEKLRDQTSPLTIHLQLMRDQQVLSDSLRLDLFRIYQQAMSNVIRHAEATEVHVRFRWDEHTILLEVEDNGKGFDVPNSWVELVRREHFGLVGLAERLESIHGKLEVVSAVGNGTLVRAIVPRP